MSSFLSGQYSNSLLQRRGGGNIPMVCCSDWVGGGGLYISESAMEEKSNKHLKKCLWFHLEEVQVRQCGPIIMRIKGRQNIIQDYPQRMRLQRRRKNSFLNFCLIMKDVFRVAGNLENIQIEVLCFTFWVTLYVVRYSKT